MAALHPQIVHFTIVFILVGVAFRLVSLFGRPACVGPAAATLLLLLAAPIARVGALRHRGAWAGGTRTGRARGRGGARRVGQRTCRSPPAWLALLELAGAALRKSPKAKAIRMAVRGRRAWRRSRSCIRRRSTAASSSTRMRAGSGSAAAIRRMSSACCSPATTIRRWPTARPAARSRPRRSLRRPRRAFRGDLEVQLLAAESQLLDRKNPQAAIEALMAIQCRTTAGHGFRARPRCSPTPTRRPGRKADAIAALDSTAEGRFPTAGCSSGSTR